MNTQKSIGKKLGVISKVDDGWFSIDGNPSIANGDGLCYIDSKGVLAGIKVNRVESTRIYPFGEIKGIKVGLEVFRNHDQQFTKQISNDSQKRLIDCKINVKQNGSTLHFSITDEDNISFTIVAENQSTQAKNPEKALESIKTQLAKSGDTIFKVVDVNVDIPNPVFLTTSAINQIRRNLLENLLQKRISSYQQETVNTPQKDYPYPEKYLSFKGNVSNSLSQRFYKKHGIEAIDDAFELQQEKHSIELMITRYCIKYEIGICPSKQNGKPTGKLYLRDNKNLYPLEFDCKNCMMKVKSPTNNQKA